MDLSFPRWIHSNRIHILFVLPSRSAAPSPAAFTAPSLPSASSFPAPGLPRLFRGTPCDHTWRGGLGEEEVCEGSGDARQLSSPSWSPSGRSLSLVRMDREWFHLSSSTSFGFFYVPRFSFGQASFVGLPSFNSSARILLRDGGLSKGCKISFSGALGDLDRPHRLVPPPSPCSVVYQVLRLRPGATDLRLFGPSILTCLQLHGCSLGFFLDDFLLLALFQLEALVLSMTFLGLLWTLGFHSPEGSPS